MARNITEIHVEDITNEINQLNTPKLQNLGETKEAFLLSHDIQSVQSQMRENVSKVLRLTWNGGRVPTGVDIGDGKEILWTQHGQVLAGKSDSGKEYVGTYDRTKDSAGPNHDEQEMIIYLDK